MSESEAADADATVVEGLSQEAPETVEAPIPVETTEPAYELSEHAQRYWGELSEELPDEFKPLAEKALKKWDAGFTLKSHEWNDRFKRYEELGDYEALQQAAQIRGLLDTDPVGFHTWLSNVLAESGQIKPGKQQPAMVDEDDDIPPAWNERFTSYDATQRQMIQVLAGLNEQVQSLAKGTTDTQLKQQLDERLNLVRVANPDVDIEFVREQVERGQNMDDAVKLYRTVRQNVVNQMGKQLPTPPVVPGSGNPPTLNGDIGDLSDADFETLTVNYLKSLQEE